MSRTPNYPSEFKEEAVKLALSSDKPTSQIAVELGIKPNTLYNWKGKAMKSKTPAPKAKKSTSHSYSELEREVKRLQKELKRTEMERDILKKAAAYFASLEL